MPHDLFISYAHQGDNTSREAVTALVARLHAELEAEFRRRFNRDLEIFFDKEDIKDFDHWQVRCHRALRDSRFFIACLSRSYLRSEACRWEWEEWCRHELEHGLVGQGAASLWFVKLEDLDAPEDAAFLRRWKGDLLGRFHIQCHEWRHDDHGNFLDSATRSELQQLTEHVAKCLRNLVTDRARRGNLPWPNANFIGREPELASLRAVLLNAPEPSPDGIHGVGGMGKTALAHAFAYKEADAFPGGCWLLRCEGRDRLLTVFSNLVTDLQIELTDEEKLDDTKAVRRVFDVLRACGPALFLLDNVDRPALLAQEQMKLLADQPWARVLYTTRLAPDEFTKASATIRPLDLDRLPENQAVDLIRRYQPGQAFASPEHEDAAREIVRELSGLTLAVETAAVYLGQCDQRVAEPQYAVDVRNYLNKLREDLTTGGSEGVMNQLREVTATLRPTLARLDAPARTVLQIASLLAPDGVALPWVRAIAGQSHPELATDAATGESDLWTQLIRGLIGMRLFQPTPEPRVVAMHRILQCVLESESTDGQRVRDKIITHSLHRMDWLIRSWANSGARWEIEPLTAWTKCLIENDPQKGGLLETQLGDFLGDVGRFQEASDLLNNALRLTETNFGCDSLETGRILIKIGGLFFKAGLTTEGEGLARRAITNLTNHLGTDHLEVWTGKNLLGALLLNKSDLENAELLFSQCASAFGRLKGPQDDLTLMAIQNLGFVEMQRGDLSNAESHIRNAFRGNMRKSGLRHPRTLVCLNNLGVLLTRQLKLISAGALLKKLLALQKSNLGPRHPCTLLTMVSAGHVLHELGNLEEAETFTNSAYLAMKEVLGPLHPNTLSSAHNLGSLFDDTDRLDKAKSFLYLAYTGRSSVLGERHPDTVISALRYVNLINKRIPHVIKELDYGKAEADLRQALEIIDKVDETHDRRAFTTLCNLGSLFFSQADYAQAETWYRRALQQAHMLVSQGERMPADFQTLTHFFSLTHERLGKSPRGNDAESALNVQFFPEAELCRDSMVGRDHDSLLSCEQRADYFSRKGDFAQADEVLRKALAICPRASQNGDSKCPEFRIILSKFKANLEKMGRKQHEIETQIRTIMLAGQ